MRTTEKVIAVLTGLGITLGAAAAHAADYYVSPTGTAAWADCTKIATPCAPDTAMTNAAAGDTVYFRGGNYYPPGVADGSFPAWYPRSSGTPASPIVIKAYPGETPNIHQPASGSSMIGSAQHDYVTWDGFILHKTATTGANSLYRCYSGDHNVIQNSEFIGNVAADSANQVGIIVNHCTETTIRNNIFRDFTGGSDVNTGAMWIFEDHHAYIYNNDFYDSSNGVQTKSTFSYIWVYNNFFRNVKKPIHWQQQFAGVTDFFVHNNIAYLPSGGTFLFAFDPSDIYYNTQVYNNTVYCPADCTGFLQGNANTHNLSVWNNIVCGEAGTTLFARYDTGAGTPIYSDFNNYYTQGTANWRLAVSPGVYSTNIYTSLSAWQTAAGFDAYSITAIPNFVNPGGNTAADYKRTSYTQDGRGGVYATVMGAYITGDEVIGYSPTYVADTLAPAAPTNLSVQ